MGKRRDDSDEPTLELPSLFRRRSRRSRVRDEPADDVASAEPRPETAPAPEPGLETPAEPVVEDQPTRAPEPTHDSLSDPLSEPLPEPLPEPSGAARSDRTAAPSAARAGDPTEERQVADETAVLAAGTVDTARPGGPTPSSDPMPEPQPEPQSAAAGGRRAARARRTGPVMPAGAASLTAGLVVGAVGAALTWAALQGCEAVRGTDSCGGPGLLVLVAILALMVVAGALLLKALRVAEPNATSFLGVGLMVVVVLVSLMEQLLTAWMFLAVPVLTALAFLAAQWVSTRFVDTEDASPRVDVR